MAFALSPGVEVNEIDLTNIIPALSTSIGGFAGQFNWGPTGTPTPIASEKQLGEVFGVPSLIGDSTEQSFFVASSFLAYSNNLRVSRAVGADTYNAHSAGVGAWATGEAAEQVTVSPAPGTQVVNLEAQTITDTNGDVWEADPEAFETDTDGSLKLKDNVDPLSLLFYGEGVDPAVQTGPYLQDPETAGKVGVFNTNPLPDMVQVSYIDEVDATGKTDVILGRYPGAKANGVEIHIIDKTKWETTDASIKAILPYAPDTTSWAAAAATDSSALNDEVHVVVVDGAGTFTGSAGTILETFTGVSTGSNSKTSTGGSNYYRTVVNRGSQYIWIAPESRSTTIEASTTTVVAPAIAGDNTLTDGTDGTPDASAIISALDIFSDSERYDVTLLFSENVINATDQKAIDDKLIEISERRKDCVAFISAPLNLNTYSNNTAKLNAVRTKQDAISSTSYAVLDSTTGYVYNRYRDEYLWIPLCGHIAGLCAKTDDLTDPWFSPAGLNRGQLRNVIKIAYNPTQEERDALYSNRINPVVSFPGSGILLYGDKTALKKPSAFDRINVRRLFTTIEKAIATASKFQLFEFNDRFTRGAFVNAVEPFLRQVQGRRGITAFTVVCDTSNNTPDIIDSNQFVADIYIQPARSINFITLNFVATRTGASFNEVG